MKVTYTLTCSICNKEVTTSYEHVWGSILMNPSLPDEWLVVDFSLVCDKCSKGLRKQLDKLRRRFSEKELA